jgi:tricarballylate dehydrogenase
MSRKAYDVVVAGGGNAGLCAALSARDDGADVLLVERSPKWRRGGNSRHTRDIRYAHEAPSRWARAPYPPEDFFAELDAFGEGLPDRELAELLVEESQTLPAWMEDHGVRWQEPLAGTLHLGTNLFFLGGGKALVNAYYTTAVARGIDVLYDSSVTELEFSETRCVAARVSCGDESEWIETRAVVAASGGLEANLDWLESTVGPAARNFIVRGTPDNDGLLLSFLFESGAKQVGSTSFHCIAVDGRTPRFDGGIVTRVDSIPLGIVLNSQGRRFFDEGQDSWPKRYAQWGEILASQPGQIAYSIFDCRSWGRFIPPMFDPIKADTIDGLLGELDLDFGQAVRTIGEFNRGARSDLPFDPTRLDGRGTTDVEPPKSNWAQPIDHPPFYAYPVRPGLTFTYLGVGIDRDARVERADGICFENVFAAGETMAGNILTRGYLAGVGLTIGSVFGRIAGRNAAHG